MRGRGVFVMPTGEGDLACGEEGGGRMAEPEAILSAVQAAFARLASGPLAGRRVVVTAGGTREADRRRALHRQSLERQDGSGARRRGLPARRLGDAWSRPSRRRPSPYDCLVVESAAEMASAVHDLCETADVLVMAAAVADYRPRAIAGGQARPRREAPSWLSIWSPPKTSSRQSARPGLLKVGFAAEAGPRIDRARAKKAAKGVDLLVFNDILAAGVGIGSDENEITILGPSRRRPRAADEQGGVRRRGARPRRIPADVRLSRARLVPETRRPRREELA